MNHTWRQSCVWGEKIWRFNEKNNSRRREESISIIISYHLIHLCTLIISHFMMWPSPLYFLLILVLYVQVIYSFKIPQNHYLNIHYHLFALLLAVLTSLIITLKIVKAVLPQLYFRMCQLFELSFSGDHHV